MQTREKTLGWRGRVPAGGGAFAFTRAPERAVSSERHGINDAWLLVLFFLIGCAVYSNVLTGFFLHDDFILLNIVKEKGLTNYWIISRYFRPLVSLTVFTDYTLWKLHPLGYHLTNMLFHAANAWLVVLIARRLMRQAGLMGAGRDHLPVFAGLLFLVLHSHTEAVSWIIARSDLVVSLFGLAAFYLYLRYREQEQKRDLLLSLALFMAALLSKEAAITFPLVLLGYELYRGRAARGETRPVWRRFAALIPYFGLLAPYFLMRKVYLGAVIGGHGNATHLDFNLTTVVLALVMFPVRMVLPYLSLHRPAGDLLPDIHFHQAVPYLLLGALLLLVTMALTGVFILPSVRRAHGKQLRDLLLLLPFLAWAFYALLIPAVTVGVVSVQNTQNERFLYFPSAFGVILVALFLSLVVARTRHLAALACVLVLGSGLLLYRSNANWRGAGDIAQSVLQSLMEQPAADRLLIVNLPDALNGAYIYRNRLAITAALQLYRDAPQFREIGVCAYNSLCDKQDSTLVSGSGGHFQVTLTDPGAYFRLETHPRERNSWTRDYTMDRLTPSGFQLTLRHLNRNDRVVYYSAGKLVPLPL